MAEVVPFPPCRRVAYVRRQADYVLTMGQAAGERHLARQVEIQKSTLLSKGVDPGLVEAACRDLESELRSALWRAVFAPGGAA